MTDYAQSEFSVTIEGSTNTIILDNDDIRDIYFIEDIYSYLKCGKLYCRDTRAINQLLPLVSAERLIIEYMTKDAESKVVPFVIIKISKVENVQDHFRNLFEVIFIEEPHKTLHMPHHSRSYKCEKYTDYIRHIAEKHAGIDAWGDFEDGNEDLQYYYTGLKTPAQCIEWLGSRTSGSVSGQPGYLLFSNTKDPAAPYNFVTLEKLLSMGELLPITPSPGYYIFQSPYDYYINRIISYDVSRVDKRAIEQLMYNIGIGWDIKRKRYLRNEYFYSDALARFTILGLYSLFEEGADGIVKCKHDLTAEPEEEFIMKNLYFGDWIKRYCLQQTVSINVEGHCDRYCGGLIEILWPTSVEDELFDKNMNGLFLVKSITHYFSPLQKPVYVQKMVLIKNGYNDSDGNLTAAGKPRLSIPFPASTFTNTDVRLADFT